MTFPQYRRRERGMTIVMVAIFIVALFALAALAVDVGVLYTARTSAQHAADAAALAGAWTAFGPNPCIIPTGGAAAPGCPAPVYTQTEAAIDAAIAVAAKNSILNQAVAITAGDVVVDEANRRVTVTVLRTAARGNAVPTFFARAMGTRFADVGAVATAEASATSTASRCIKPIFLPNTILSTKPVGPGPGTACTVGETIFDANGNLTTFAKQQIGGCMNVRPTSANEAKQNSLLAPSQFFSLDFGSGGSTYRCAWGGCLNACPNVNTSLIQCGDKYPLETGDMVGPTKQGVGDLVTNTPDTWVGVGQYQAPNGTISDTSDQLTVAPIWDDCSQTIHSGTNGQQVTVIGFLEIFVDGMSNQNGCLGGGGGGKGGGGGGNYVQAHPVNPLSCGALGVQAGSGTGPLAIPIRLVQAP